MIRGRPSGKGPNQRLEQTPGASVLKPRPGASALEQALVASARQGILPITSACNTRCIFCSHRQNPPGVEAYHLPPRSLGEIEASLDLMPDPEKIVIGESVTRIMEGEPFTHPAIDEILRLIRTRFPNAIIELTTNGTLLDENRIDWLNELGGMEVNLSLNCLEPGLRRKIMSDRNGGTAPRAAELLGRRGICYHGSIVAMPWIAGWDDLRQVIRHFDQSQARTVRIFLPGFTRLAPVDLRFDAALWDEVAAFVDGLRAEVRVPLVSEPSRLSDLRPVVLGVIAESPAGSAGLAVGDVLTAVNGVRPFSRVDAFGLVKKSGNPAVTVQRGAILRDATIGKEPGQQSGLVMEFDLDPRDKDLAVQVIKRRRARRVAVLTSVLARSVVALGLENAIPRDVEFAVGSVPSLFFGGSIVCAGLLVADDFLRHVDKTGWPLARPDLAIIPRRAFDETGRDLTGRSYLDLEDEWGVPVELV